MYKAVVSIDSFGSDLASYEESIRVVATARYWKKELRGSRFEGTFEVREFFKITSPESFVVVVTAKASGQDAHLAGVSRMIVANKSNYGKCINIPVEFTSENKEVAAA